MRIARDIAMNNTEKTQWNRRLGERAAEFESELRTAEADEDAASLRTPHVQGPDTADAAEERLRTGEFGTCRRADPGRSPRGHAGFRALPRMPAAPRAHASRHPRSSRRRAAHR